MNKDFLQAETSVESLQQLSTIRRQAQRMLDLACQHKLNYFEVDLQKIPDVADFVVKVIHDQYPTLDIPYHSRWRHFEAGGVDRVQQLDAGLRFLSMEARGKILYELVIISVLLDAGAGEHWHYNEPFTGLVLSRSEGLAVASLDLYLSGALSANTDDPLRVDGERLLAFQPSDLMNAFQVSAANPLEGVDGRVKLLNQLGAIVGDKTRYFGKEGRLGDFFSYVASLQSAQCITAHQLFAAVLAGFSDVWPKRLQYNGESLGDVWQHQSLKTDVPGSDYIPFHKLSQWLTYSLIEPLEQSGIKITDLDALTGLPEYRNGGLLIDAGVLRVKDDRLYQEPQHPSSESIVEWRGLTVALLDELAHAIRKQLGMTAIDLPLAKILQGGTWEAGRRIAKQKRAKGTPPIQIISDGTIF